MRTKGLVISNADNRSEILVYRSEACGSCSSCGGCGDSTPSTVWIENSLNAQPGQMVTVEMDNAAFIKNTIKMYFIPMLMFVVGLLATHFIQESMGQVNEVITLFGGLIAMSIFIVLGKLIDKKAEEELALKMIRVQTIEESIQAQ